MSARLSLGLKSEFRSLRIAMHSLDQTLQRLTSAGGVRTTISIGGPRRKVRLSPKARASLVLQGRYMGFMRQLKPRQKAMVRRVKERQGVRVAIAKARGLASA